MAQTATRPPFLSLLRSAGHDLTATEKRVVDHLLVVWPELPLTSATELAQDLAINPSSITRLAQNLGFRGYPDMQRAVRHELRQRHQPQQPQGAGSAQRHWQQEAELIEQMRHFPEDQIDGLTREIAQARRVYLAGARGSSSSAIYAAHLLQTVRPEVVLLPEDAFEHPQRWLEAGQGDLLLAFTFKRYAQATARLIMDMTAQGATLALMTDSPNAPGARQAAHLIVLPSPQLSEGRFLKITATVSLLLLITSKLTDLMGTQRIDQLDERYGQRDVFSY